MLFFADIFFLPTKDEMFVFGSSRETNHVYGLCEGNAGVEEDLIKNLISACAMFCKNMIPRNILFPCRRFRLRMCVLLVTFQFLAGAQEMGD